jgi:hypothetical protein
MIGLAGNNDVRFKKSLRISEMAAYAEVDVTNQISNPNNDAITQWPLGIIPLPIDVCLYTALAALWITRTLLHE